jgi:hypothetical protein
MLGKKKEQQWVERRSSGLKIPIRVHHWCAPGTHLGRLLFSSTSISRGDTGHGDSSAHHMSVTMLFDNDEKKILVPGEALVKHSDGT